MRSLLLLLGVLALATQLPAVSSQGVGWPAMVNGQCTGTRERKAFVHLSCTQRNQLKSALTSLKKTGIYDIFIKIHEENADICHGTPWFLPWHRWFVWIFENELRKASGICVTVPYWDTENENGIELKSRVFVSAIFGSATDVGTATDPISGRSQGPWCVTKGVAAYPGWQDENGNCLIRYFESWLQQPEKSDVLARLTKTANMNFYDFRRDLEGSPHSTAHLIISGHMAAMKSPFDPLFYLHHSNIDRLWAFWMDYWGYDQVSKVAATTAMYSSIGATSAQDIDVPMTFNYNGVPLAMFFVPGTSSTPTARQMLKIGDNAPLMYSFGPDALVNDLEPEVGLARL